MMNNILKNILILITLVSVQNLFAADFFSTYQYCLQDLNNYQTIGYKSNKFCNSMREININPGFLISTDGFYDISVAGRGFFRVIKNHKYYYTRQGEFFFNSEENNIVNKDDYTLVLRNRIDEDSTRIDIMVGIRLFVLNIQKCHTSDNIYFECEEIPDIDPDSSIIFGYLDSSNVSAFYCLLLMRYIIYENSDYIDNFIFLSETINILIQKLNNNEYTERGENWNLLKEWLPYLELKLK